MLLFLLFFPYYSAAICYEKKMRVLRKIIVLVAFLRSEWVGECMERMVVA